MCVCVCVCNIGSENVGRGFLILFGHEIPLSFKYVYTDGVQKEIENDAEKLNNSTFYTEKLPYTYTSYDFSDLLSSLYSAKLIDQEHSSLPPYFLSSTLFKHLRR